MNCMEMSAYIAAYFLIRAGHISTTWEWGNVAVLLPWCPSPVMGTGRASAWRGTDVIPLNDLAPSVRHSFVGRRIDRQTNRRAGLSSFFLGGLKPPRV